MTVQSLSQELNKVNFSANIKISSAQETANALDAKQFKDALADGSLNTTDAFIKMAKLARDEAQKNAVDEITWNVDKENQTINLDNGYRIQLLEGRSQFTLEKLNEKGEVEKSTRIWGDPHIDIGNDGKTDADFWKQTTLALEDGTKISIGTRSKGGNMTYSDTLTITKGDQAVEVTGLMSGADEMKIGDVTTNGKALDKATNDGYIMYEGEGNTWALEDGTVLSQEASKRNFAITEKENEITWGNPHDDPSNERGSFVMPESIRSFLENHEFFYRDAGGDNELTVSEWDDLITKMEANRDELSERDDAHLAIMSSIVGEIIEMFHEIQRNTEETNESSTSESGSSAPAASTTAA